jgi:hypothetical protein
MTRKLSFVTAVAGLALVVVGSAAGKGQPVEQQWQQALEARGLALNQQYGIGTESTSVGPMEARSDALKGGTWVGRPTTSLEPSTFEQALQARGEALNRQYGIGVTANRIDTNRYEQALHARSEGLNRIYELGSTTQGTATVAKDAFERAVASGPSRIESTHLRGDDFVRADPSDVPVVVRTTSVGSEFEWPQIGMGFAFGLLLMLGIALTVRYTRVHPLAH